MTLFGKQNNPQINEAAQAELNGTMKNETEKKSNAAKTLGSRIAEARKAHGLTQEEFSEKLGVTAQAVSKWENDISCPDIQLIPKIAKLFEITTDELLTGNKTSCNTNQPESPQNSTDKSKLKLRISVTEKGKDKTNISIPLKTVKKFAKIGNGISGIIGNASIESDDFNEILNLVESGATGELLNIETDENTTVIISVE